MKFFQGLDRLSDSGSPIYAAMQQYAEEATLSDTAGSRLSVVKGLNDGQRHVVKRVRCIPCKTKEQQMALAYAVQESRLLMQMRHPNILRAQDFFTEGAHYCIVLEYCAGGDLKQQIDAAASARTCLAASSVLGWIEGIASAAKYFHVLGVLHRDLKPANILLTALAGRPADVRVGDFGAARQIRTGQGSIQAKPTGTRQYMVRQTLLEECEPFASRSVQTVVTGCVRACGRRQR